MDRPAPLLCRAVRGKSVPPFQTLEAMVVPVRTTLKLPCHTQQENKSSLKGASLLFNILLGHEHKVRPGSEQVRNEGLS